MHSAIMKLRSGTGIPGRTYDSEKEIDRTLTGSGLTRRLLFWGAAFQASWMMVSTEMHRAIRPPGLGSGSIAMMRFGEICGIPDGSARGA